MSSGGATLLGSFSGATGTIHASGFVWGESADDLRHDITLGSHSGTSGSLSYELDGLMAGRKYYYQAYVQVWDDASSTAIPKYGAVESFTTSEATLGVPSTWLEIPAITGDEDFIGVFYGSGGNTDANRNYSYYYNTTYYASLWTAYHLTAAHKSGNASNSKWKFNPNINEVYQIDMTGNSYNTMYGVSNYSKGHQCPNADRLSNQQMNTQTYYCTNQTPQIQNGFNGSIWSALETAERNLVSNSDDVVYIITGPVYKTKSGNEPITYFEAATGQDAYPAEVPVPNYYWKAMLKVKMSGNTVTSAKAIGFWFDHKQYSNSNYAACACSVDYIEQMTGFDLFVNLPGDNNSGIEKTAEANTSWTDFQNF